MQVGKDCIGVGVGAFIINDQYQVLLSLRGPEAKNERGRWEIPGGAVEFGETLESALKREVAEEIGVEIQVLGLLYVNDHILPEEQQHWVSPTFICQITQGTPTIQEPTKSTQLRWVTLEEAEQLPLASVTRKDLGYLKTNQEILTKLLGK